MTARLALLAALLLTPVFAWAQPVADHVPADALIYIGWQGAADMGPGFAQSHLKAVLDDSQFREFVNDFLPRVIDKVGQLNPQAGQIGQIIATIAKPSWRRPTAFFFAGIEQAPNQPPTPHLGVIWEAGPDAGALGTQLDQLIAQSPAPFPVKVFHQGPLVALLVGYDDPQNALPSDAGKSLANDPAFKAAMAHLTLSNPVAGVYVNWPALTHLTDTLVPQFGGPDAASTWGSFRDAFGLGTMGKMVGASGFDGKDFASQLFIEKGSAAAGGLVTPGPGPLDPRLIAAIPQDVTIAGALQFDAGRLYDLLHKVAAASDSGQSEQFDQSLAAIRRQTGIDIRRDLLGSIGKHWAYYTDPAVSGVGLSGMVFINRLADPDTFERSMIKIEDYALVQVEKEMDLPKNVHIGFETTQIDGMTIHYLAIPLAAPCWLIRDGNLYVAMFPQAAAAAADYAAAKKPSIQHNPQFLALLKRLGQEHPASFSYVDLPRTAPYAYGSWMMLSRLTGVGDVFGVRSPPMLLPRLDQILAQLEPSASAAWSDESGVHLRTIEPFPASGLLASDPLSFSSASMPLMISILLPALNRAREQANRVKSASNLRQMGQGMAVYANGHQFNFPPDLGVLATEQDVPPQVFLNPRVHDEQPPADKAQWRGWVDGQKDYVYVAQGKSVARVAPDAIIAYENPSQNTEGINIMYGDFHVEWHPMAEARDEIAKIKH